MPRASALLLGALCALGVAEASSGGHKIDEHDLVPSYLVHAVDAHALKLKQRFSQNPSDGGRGGRNSAWWWTLNWDPSLRCLLDERVGASQGGDGGKWLCDSAVLLDTPECTVFSIGGNNQWGAFCRPTS